MAQLHPSEWVLQNAILNRTQQYSLLQVWHVTAFNADSPPQIQPPTHIVCTRSLLQALAANTLIGEVSTKAGLSNSHSKCANCFCATGAIKLVSQPRPTLFALMAQLHALIHNCAVCNSPQGNGMWQRDKHNSLSRYGTKSQIFGKTGKFRQFLPQRV
jgi:hypothetical protein